MVNYQLRKIYKIVDNTNGNVYVGSTCEPTLAKRLGKHRDNYKSYMRGKYHFITAFNIIQNDSYDIVLLENYPCNNKDELHARERYYVESIECINKCIPNRTELEYYHDNKEYYRAQHQQYYKDNKKKYYEENKDDLLNSAKQYREDHKEKIQKYGKQYREDNQEKYQEKFICECGGKYTYTHKTQHSNSKKHMEYLNSL